MATICLAYGLRPKDYWQLTIAEHEAMRRLLKELEKKS